MFRIADYEIQSIHDEIDYVIPQSIKLTNVQTLWDKGYYGKGIHIAVLDTGIDTNHICLKDRIVETKNFIDGTDDVRGRPKVEDENPTQAPANDSSSTIRK